MIENTGHSEGKFVMALAANKCDMPTDKHKISEKLTDEIASKYDMIHMKVSAKTGEGLPEMFKKISEKVQKINLMDD
jgi:50S ribosomal subunit-associated GTPase HflX